MEQKQEPNNNTLYGLVAQSNSLTEEIIKAGGELTPELEAALSNVDLAIADKVDGYQLVMDRLKQEEAYWKKRAEELARVGKACGSARERLKNSLKDAMKAMGKTEAFGISYRFKLSDGKSALVIDEATLDPAYLITVTEKVPDKERIEAALRAGKTVEGASLRPVTQLRDYPNRRTA